MDGRRETIGNDFRIIVGRLSEIAKAIEENLVEITQDIPNVDRIQTRVKGKDSLIEKALAIEGDKFKYEIPLKEIQDVIGARVVVYYKKDVEPVKQRVAQFYHSVEEHTFVPDSVTKFGYEGFHTICFIPSAIYSEYATNPLMPRFFELQIKTLYQHAWSQTNHGLGYKTKKTLTYDEERKLAFLAAQSWGADNILSDLSNS